VTGYHGPVRRVVAVVVLASAGCSFLTVDRRPPVAEVTTPSDCTDSYAVPLVDLAVVAGLVGWSFYIAHKLDDRDCERERCDPQDGVAIVVPYIFALPVAVSSVWGARQVHRCRDLQDWQSRQPFFPHAGEVGHRCIPTDPGRGRCLSSSCIDGLCVDCTTPITALEDARDAAERRRLFHAMPPGCRQTLALTCSPISLGARAGQPYPESCRYLFSAMEAGR